jgi:hypothetical protein
MTDRTVDQMTLIVLVLIVVMLLLHGASMRARLTTIERYQRVLLRLDPPTALECRVYNGRSL